MAIASLVLGIVGLVFAIIPGFGWLGGILGVVGIILAVVAKKQGATGGAATAGLVLSIIAAALGLILYIACVACVKAAGSALEDVANSISASLK